MLSLDLLCAPLPTILLKHYFQLMTKSKEKPGRCSFSIFIQPSGSGGYCGSKTPLGKGSLQLQSVRCWPTLFSPVMAMDLCVWWQWRR
jgi:hypothetical protein